MKMKTGILLLFIFLQTYSQEIMIGPRNQIIYDARYVQIPPAFPFGTDSCKHYYFNQFKGFDSLIVKAVEQGDTGKFLRIYFSFVVDKNGFVLDGQFLKIASTRMANSLGAKTVSYFANQKSYFNRKIQMMCLEMPLWKPAMQNGFPVSSRVFDFLQCWVGLTKPKMESVSSTNHAINHPIYAASSKSYLGHYVNHLLW